MTIDEIIEELASTKDYPASDPASDEALDGAIEVVRKYQKIEQIVKNTQQLCSYGSAFIDIREVIEDG